MKFCEEKEIYYDVFGNTSIKIFWTKGIAEAKTEKNLELFQETIKNNFDLINSTLKKNRLYFASSKYIGFRKSTNKFF